jgi:hypothetical protein
VSIAEGMREIAELAKKQGNVDLYTRILELRIEMIEISEEKLKLQAKVNELEEGLRVKDQMTFSEPFWYREGDDTPHCPACYEKDNRAIHLLSLDHAADGRFSCPVCKLLCYGAGGRGSTTGSYRTPSRGGQWS